jgi:oligopeptidase A
MKQRYYKFMQNFLPNFSNIKSDQIEPRLDQLLNENRTRIAELLNNSAEYNWDNLVHPLEELADRLHKYWSPISHLHSVKQTPELRAAYQACLPKLTAYHTELEQNEKLYQAFLSLAENSNYQQLNSAQQKIIQNQLRDFRLAGVALPADKKQRYAEIQTQLAELTTRFENNLLDSTEHWIKHITDETELAGVPEHVLASAKTKAQEKNLSGWLLTLHFPCYYPIMCYAQNRALRQELYTAYTTRASDQAVNKQYDNSATMQDIMRLRQELSQLLDMQHYAELSLATKMASNPKEVLDFLYNLLERVRPQAQAELQELKAFAKQQDNIDLQVWDSAYYSEKLREQRYQFNDETLRPYFPVDTALTGMFDLVKRLYGMEITAIKNFDTWHNAVQAFEIRDAQKKIRGHFYVDLYARAQKRGGAWMDDYCSRLTPPNGEQPALLTHEEVSTLFHEFGHGLHHMLTQVDYASVAGINGVEWDAVELPSQFMEFFTWEKNVLAFVSKHYVTGETLPEQLLQPLFKAKNFHSALHLLRQLELALFDFRLHCEFKADNTNDQIQTIINEIRKTTALLPVPAFNRFQHSFSHIFAGGYAAGYYSYLWAEVLACDAFAKFQEEGVLNRTTGEKFLQTILEVGGTRKAMESFVAFRGRGPKIEALLQQYGIN